MKLILKDTNFKPTLKQINTLENLFIHEIEKLDDGEGNLEDKYLIKIASISNPENFFQFEASKKDLLEGADFDVIDKKEDTFVVFFEDSETIHVPFEEVEIDDNIIAWYCKGITSITCQN